MKDAYVFGPFRVDARKRRLWKGEQVVPLTPKAFETLLALVRRAGEVVDKDDLLEIVWPNVHVSEETLTQNISTIRKALGDTSEHPEYVATVPRRGYQFISAVNEAGLGDPVALPDPVVSMSGPTLAPTMHRDVRKFGWVGLAVLSMVVGAALAFAYLRPSPGPVTAAEWEVLPPEGTALVSGGALSPDGRRLAFVTRDQQGHKVLRVRVLGSIEAPAVPGSEGARDPFWSPDSRSIAFCADGKLKRTDLSGRPPRTVAEVFRGARGGTWSQSGLILLPAAFKSALFRIDAEGGPPVQLTRLADGERAHVWPWFLPDGRHFLYRVVGFSPEQSGTYLGSLDSAEKTRLLDARSSAAIYAPPGYLLFVQDGSLVAQRLDLAGRRLEGPVFPLAANVAAPDANNGLPFSAAGDRVAYVAGGTHAKLEWFDREGRSRGVLDGTAEFQEPTLSPDETTVLAMRLESETDSQIWLTSSAGGTPSRLGTGLARGGMSVWAPDGLSIAFTSAGSLYRVPVPVRGDPKPELLLKPDTTSPLWAHDWSPDGRALVYMATSATSGMDIWWLSLDNGAAHPFDATRFNELQGQVSPDSRWIAYTSDESGTWEVYVQAFPDGGYKQKVSQHGGAQPKWRRSDGGELFFLDPDQTMMSVDVRAGSQDGLSMGPPQALFAVRLAEELTRRRNHYAVTRDGKRFLVSTVQPFPPPLKVKLNWTANLR